MEEKNSHAYGESLFHCICCLDRRAAIDSLNYLQGLLPNPGGRYLCKLRHYNRLRQLLKMLCVLWPAPHDLPILSAIYPQAASGCRAGFRLSWALGNKPYCSSRNTSDERRGGGGGGLGSGKSPLR